MRVTRGGLAQTVLVVAGGWLMFAPSVLGHAGDTIGKSDRIAGPLILSIAFLAIFPITRLLRWGNLPIGVWLLIAPWVLGAASDATISDLVVGVLVLALAPVERAEQDRYGGGWDTLTKRDRLPR